MQQLVEFVRGSASSSNDRMAGGKELKASNKTYFIAYLNLDQNRMREDLTTIRLFRLIENRHHVEEAVPEQLPADNQETVLLNGLKRELQSLEKAKATLAKRVTLLKSIASEIVEPLGENNGRDSRKAMQKKKVQMERVLANLEDQLVKQTEERDSLLESVKQPQEELMTSTYRKLTLRAKERLSHRQKENTILNATNAQGQLSRNSAPPNDLNFEQAYEDQRLRHQMKQAKLREAHQREMKQLDEKHQAELSQLKQVAELRALLERASKYPELSVQVARYAPLIKFC